MLLLAWVIALEMATGTSRALPKPKPTRPAPSPTTVSAVKPNCRPPLTTFAVRLTATSFSTSSSWGWPFSALAIVFTWLELEARFARGLGERLHAPVVLESRTVEGDLLDARGLSTLRNGLADGLGGIDIAGALEALAHRVLQRRGGGYHRRSGRVGDLCIDMTRRAMHREARDPEVADVRACLDGAAH